MIPIKQLFDTLGAAADTVNEIKLKKEILDMRQSLLTVFEAHNELLEKQNKLILEINDLKEKIQKQNAWNDEKKEYEIFSYREDTHLYRKKGSPDHGGKYFCPNCFETRQCVVHLQGTPGKMMSEFFCPSCRNAFSK